MPHKDVSSGSDIMKKEVCKEGIGRRKDRCAATAYAVAAKGNFFVGLSYLIMGTLT